jgi:DNA-binding NtrC family response regulator
MEMKNLLMTFVQQKSLLPHSNIFTSNNSMTLKEIEKQTILKCLGKTNFNRRLAAKTLGISERTLYRKMKEYDLEDKNRELTENNEI